MNSEVTMVRIYLTEGETQLKTLLKRLRDWEKLRGVTVFRGITGYGDSGVIHGADIIDLSLHLPIVLEFFDSPDKIEEIRRHLEDIVKPGHMVYWNAQINL
jgi:PII-like signaling protein